MGYDSNHSAEKKDHCGVAASVFQTVFTKTTGIANLKHRDHFAHSVDTNRHIQAWVFAAACWKANVVTNLGGGGYPCC